MNPSRFWTPELRAEAVRQHHQGASAGFIAKLIGAPTRSAVCGVLFRAGLRRGKKPTVLRVPQPPRPIKARRVVIRAPRAQPRPLRTPPRSDPVRLLDLTGRHCRWPLDDPGRGRMDAVMFCGAPTAPCRPYCPFHLHASLVPRDPAQRRRG